MATAISAILMATLLGQAPTLWAPPSSPAPRAEVSPNPSAQPSPTYGYYARNADRLWGPGSYDSRFGFGPRFGYGDRYGNTSGFVSPYGFGTRYGYLNRYGGNPYVNENRTYPNLGLGETGAGAIPAGDLTSSSSWGDLAPWLWGIPGPSLEQAAPPLEQPAPTVYSVRPIAPVKPEELTPRPPGVLPKPMRAPASQGAAEPAKAPATRDVPQAEP